MYDPTPTSPKKRRHLRHLLIVAAIVLIAAVASLPWVLSTPLALRALLLQVNYTIRPSRVQLNGLRVSWAGPLRLTGLALRAPSGKMVVSASEAILDRGLFSLLFARSHAMRLTLRGTALDLERRADGSLDLVDALAPLHPSRPKESRGPGTDFTIRVIDGTLRLRVPELAEPLTADRLALTWHAPPAPGPAGWTIDLAKASDAGAGTLAITGHLDHHAAAEGDLDLRVGLGSWPLAVGPAGVVTRGRITGDLAVARKSGRLALQGAATTTGLALSGTALGRDTLRLDRLESRWDAVQTGQGWSVRRLDLQSPIGSLALVDEPRGAAPVPIHLHGQVDLAAIAAQLPHALRLREDVALERGLARIEATEQIEGEHRRWQVRAEVADLFAHHEGRPIVLEHPATVTARLDHRAGGLALEQLEVATAFLRAEGSGDQDRGILVNAVFDLDRLRRELGSWVDLGDLQLAGQCRLSADYRRDSGGYLARTAVEGRGLVVAGLTAEPIRRDSARFEAVLRGPSRASGAPGGWSSARFGLKSGPLDAELTAAHGSAIALALKATAPLRSDGSGATAEPPASLVLRGKYAAEDDRLDIEQLALACRYGTLAASGRLDDPDGRRVADLRGTLSPDWEALRAAVDAATDPSARLSGRARPFRLTGPLAAASLAELIRGLDAEAGLDLTEAEVFGLTFGPMPLAVRCRGGQVQVDPIATTVNGGRLDLRPEVWIGAAGDIALTLAPGSVIEKAEINDAVSSSVLSYVAPVLDRATAVRGHVSARIDRAEIPLSGPPDRSVSAAAGQLVFQQVTYGPGPLMQGLVGLTGHTEVPHLTIDQPLEFTVADRRVHQSGLSVQVTPEVRIELAGSVGFDGSLALRAGVPVTAAMLGHAGALDEILAGTRVGVPIDGSFACPTLDRTAFREGLRATGRTLMGRAASRGATELLRRLQGTPDAPPPGAEGKPEAPPSEGAVDLGRGLLRELIPGSRPPQGEPKREAPPKP